MKKLLVLLGAVALIPGCINAGQHRAEVRDDSADRISVAHVQREIKVGMSGADVIAVLGSPNMVTSDSQRRETWVFTPRPKAALAFCWAALPEAQAAAFLAASALLSARAPGRLLPHSER